MDTTVFKNGTNESRREFYANVLKEALLPACPDGSNDSIAVRN
jgi:hypothetical protein